jgi:hypothetical protein
MLFRRTLGFQCRGDDLRSRQRRIPIGPSTSIRCAPKDPMNVTIPNTVQFKTYPNTFSLNCYADGAVIVPAAVASDSATTLTATAHAEVSWSRCSAASGRTVVNGPNIPVTPRASQIKHLLESENRSKVHFKYSRRHRGLLTVKRLRLSQHIALLLLQVHSVQ